MNLFYNPETKIIFGSDDTQPVGMNLITSNDVPDLIANGATVDSSADSVLAPLDAGNAAAGAPAPDAPATGSDTAETGASNTAVAGGVADAQQAQYPDQAQYVAALAPTYQTLTPEQKAAQDVVDAGAAPAGDANVGQFTSADGTTAPTEEIHPAHEAANALERFMERISNDFLKEGKALVAAVRAEITKLL